MDHASLFRVQLSVASDQFEEERNNVGKNSGCELTADG
jgi:hypothetical protein